MAIDIAAPQQQAEGGANLPSALAQWLKFVYAAAAKYALDPALVLAVIDKESSGRNVVGTDGHGRGLMQIDDRWHGAWCQQHQMGMDPQSNIDYGCMLLRQNIDHFDGDIRCGVAAYNAGQRGAQNGLNDSGNPDQYTTGGHYSERVCARADELRALLGSEAAEVPVPSTYTVAPGDTLGLIAAHFSTTVAALAQANGILNPNLIYVGQVLHIPGLHDGEVPAPVPGGSDFVVGPGIVAKMQEDGTLSATDEIQIFGGRAEPQWAEAIGANGVLYRWVRETNQVYRFPGQA